MNIIWGLIIAAVGALFITWGRTKSDFGLYRLSGQRTRVARTAGQKLIEHVFGFGGPT